MADYYIKGGEKLYGSIELHGSKNAALPVLAATLLHKGTTVLHGCPDILDVRYMLEMIRSMGGQVHCEGETVTIDAKKLCVEQLSRSCIGKMRSSILLLGALAGRCSELILDYPGGCTIGERPIDIHLNALERMGVHIETQAEQIRCRVKYLEGRKIYLPYPSVGATENIMMAGVRAEGITWIHNAAKEPEIVELAKFLEAMGVVIHGAGTDCIALMGKCPLKDTEYKIMGDRIVAGTYLLAAAGAGGEIEVLGIDEAHIHALLHLCEEMGCVIRKTAYGIYLKSDHRLFSVTDIHTQPFPGVPTDLQPQLMAVLSAARGQTTIYEHVFENRFRTAKQLVRMGADIKIIQNKAVIRGVDKLHGCCVAASDLRGGAALIIAGLMAEGDTIVANSVFVERGYQNICKDLTQLGANMKVINRK